MTLAFQGLLKAIMVMVVTTLRNTDTDANSHMQRVDGETNLWTSVDERFEKVPGTAPQKGSFGVTWQVEDRKSTSGEIRALKILYYTEKGENLEETDKMLSMKSAKQYNLGRNVLDGRKECEIQQYLAYEGARAPNHMRKGAQRFVACYETNIPSKDEWSFDSEEPLWILMENGGEKTLGEWISDPEWNLEKAKLFFKQLVEGLNFLGAIMQPHIHHDLKPDNILIKERGHSGTFLLKIIDFGGAAKISESSRFGDFLAATEGFSPWEFSSKAVECVSEPDKKRQWFDMCERDHCGPACGLAYDVFSAGQIWINMILGEPSDTWGYSVQGENIELEDVLNSFKDEEIQHKNDIQNENQFDKFGAVVGELERDSFFKDIKATINAMLMHNAADRITARQLLNKQWMLQIDTPEYLGQMPQAGEGSDFARGQRVVFYVGSGYYVSGDIRKIEQGVCTIHLDQADDVMGQEVTVHETYSGLFHEDGPWEEVSLNSDADMPAQSDAKVLDNSEDIANKRLSATLLPQGQIASQKERFGSANPMKRQVFVTCPKCKPVEKHRKVQPQALKTLDQEDKDWLGITDQTIDSVKIGKCYSADSKSAEQEYPDPGCVARDNQILASREYWCRCE